MKVKKYRARMPGTARGDLKKPIEESLSELKPPPTPPCKPPLKVSRGEELEAVREALEVAMEKRVTAAVKQNTIDLTTLHDKEVETIVNELEISFRSETERIMEEVDELKGSLIAHGGGEYPLSFLMQEDAKMRRGQGNALAQQIAEEVVKNENDFRDFGVERVQEYVSTIISTNATVFSGTANTRAIPRALLIRMQAAVFEKFLYDPHIGSVIKNYVAYVLGQGVKWEVHNEKISAWLSEFWQRNTFEERQRAIFRMGMIDGEVFLNFYIDAPSGKVSLRRTEPNEIVEITRHTEDKEVELAFRRSYRRSIQPEEIIIKSTEYDEQVRHPELAEGMPKLDTSKFEPNTEMMHFKINAVNEYSIVPPFLSCLKWSTLYLNYLTDASRRHHELSRILFVEEKVGVASRSRSGKTRRPVPDGTEILKADGGTSYKFLSPGAGGSSDKTLGLSLLYMICSGAVIPISIVDMNAENENYASIRKADSPFVQAVLAWQDIWRGELVRMLRYVISKGVEAGKLEATATVEVYDEEILENVYNKVNEFVVDEHHITEEEIEDLKKEVEQGKKLVTVPSVEIPIEINFPEMIREDALALARVLDIHKKIGIASVQTLSEKAGYDWKMEFHRLVKEKKQKLKDQKEAFDQFAEGKLPYPNDGGNAGDKGDKGTTPAKEEIDFNDPRFREEVIKTVEGLIENGTLGVRENMTYGPMENGVET